MKMRNLLLLILSLFTVLALGCSSTRSPAGISASRCLIIGAERDLVNWGPDFLVGGEERIHFRKNICPRIPEGDIGQFCSCPAKNWRTGEVAVLKGIIMN